MQALPAVARTVSLACIDASAGEVGTGFRDIPVEVDGERSTAARTIRLSRLRCAFPVRVRERLLLSG